MNYRKTYYAVEMSNQKVYEKKKIKKDDIPKLDFNVGNHEVIINHRYEIFYTLNDILIAVFFIIGSILFFWDVTEAGGISLFLLGSIGLLLRPFIRIKRNTYLKRFYASKIKPSGKNY